MQAWRAHVPAALLSLVVLAIALGGDSVAVWLRYDRQAVSDGEFWRLFSGHLVHASGPHAALNLAGLGLLSLLFAPALPAVRWAVVFVSLALATGSALYFLEPALAWYVGLSGVLHGMYIVGVAGDCARVTSHTCLLWAVMGVKLTLEQLGWLHAGGTPDDRIVVNAHLYGALAGLVAAGLFAWFRRVDEGKRLS